MQRVRILNIRGVTALFATASAPAFAQDVPRIPSGPVSNVIGSKVADLVVP
jgi:hypothetical protein